MKQPEERIIFSVAKSDDITYSHTYNPQAKQQDFVYHTHDRYELIFLIRGDMSYIAEGRSYDLDSGDLVLTRPGVFHAMMPKRTTRYERYDVIINEQLIPKSVRKRLPKEREVFKCCGSERIFELFAKLDLYYKSFDEDEYAPLAFSITQEVIYNLTLPDVYGTRASVNPLVDKATEYVSENLCSIKSVEEISRALYVTKSHLHHIFTKYLHMTPAKYVLSKRLLLAEKKILRGGKPTEVSAECGFENYSTFFRNYKKHFGCAPSAESSGKITREII